MSFNKHLVLDIFMIMLGTTIMAFGISVFYSPNDMITGGITGLSIIIEKLASERGLNIPIWLSNAVLNSPLFILGFRILGFKNIAKTLFATVFLSFALYFTSLIPIIKTDLILASIFGGTIGGLGLGIVFKSMATTGGTDLAANIIHKYIKHISMAKIMLVLDSAVVILGLFIFGPIKAMYAIVSIFVSTKVIDAVLEGLTFAKCTFIISQNSNDIAAKILQIDRGVTAISVKGMYTNAQKDMLMCVVSAKQIVTLKQIVHEIDPAAFVIVADVREVLGEGFNSISQ